MSFCPKSAPVTSLTAMAIVAMTAASTSAFAQSKTAADPVAPRTSAVDAAAKAEPANPALPDLNALVAGNQVGFQTALDGSIYGVGGNYKARFTGAGMTYAPRGGEHITFALQSASVGGKMLPLNANAQVSVDGQTVSIDRGAFVEQYALSADSIEQLFTINANPGHGDLVLKIAASMPSMIATERGTSLEFASERGTVNYSKAVLVDEAGARTNLSTKVNDGMIEIRVPSSTLNDAQFPITIDPVISSGEMYSSTVTRHADVAYDATSNRFVVVFEYEFGPNDGDIYSVMLNTNGAVIAGTLAYPDATFDNWRKPSVANNNIANKFMVAAEKGLAPTRGIWGNTINPADGVVGAQFEMIGGAGGEKTNPDIGGDSFLIGPTYFLVVWEYDFAPGDHDIAGRLFTAAGVQQGGELFLDLSATNQSNPAVSKSNRGEQWMVVWQNTFAPDDEDLWATVINWDGAVYTATEVFDFSGANHTNPDVSSPLTNGRYLAVYETTGTHTIATRLANSSLDVLDSASLESLGDNPFGKPRYEPTVDADGSKFVVGYSEQYLTDLTDWDFYASTICASNNDLRLAEMHENLDFSGWIDRHAAVATTWSGGGAASSAAIFAWTHAIAPPSQFGTIHAGRYNAHTSCCPADIAPVGGDGQINVIDLLAVINQWSGSCMNCSADINGDFQANVSDLLAVINAWGTCP